MRILCRREEKAREKANAERLQKEFETAEAEKRKADIRAQHKASKEAKLKQKEAENAAKQQLQANGDVVASVPPASSISEHFRPSTESNPVVDASSVPRPVIAPVRVYGVELRLTCETLVTYSISVFVALECSVPRRQLPA